MVTCLSGVSVPFICHGFSFLFLFFVLFVVWGGGGGGHAPMPSKLTEEYYIEAFL